MASDLNAHQNRSSPRRRGPRLFIPASCDRSKNLDARLSGTSGGEVAIAFYTYILASYRNGTLYVGMTDDLNRRMVEHQTKVFPGFTAKYGVTRLVWYEQFETREAAFARERAIKKWNRLWKLRLIERFNPSWRDLSLDLEFN